MSNASATIAKPAKKTAAAKPAAAKKAPSKSKTASKGARATVRTSAKITHAVGQSCRPVAGAHLFAYTAAWLSLTGMDKGAAIPRAELVKIAGERAAAYHLKAGNLKAGKDGISVTAKGAAAFSARTVDPQIVDAYKGVLTTGKPSDVARVKAEHIVSLKAAA